MFNKTITFYKGFKISMLSFLENWIHTSARMIALPILINYYPDTTAIVILSSMMNAPYFASYLVNYFQSNIEEGNYYRKMIYGYLLMLGGSSLLLVKKFYLLAIIMCFNGAIFFDNFLSAYTNIQTIGDNSLIQIKALGNNISQIISLLVVLSLSKVVNLQLISLICCLLGISMIVVMSILLPNCDRPLTNTPYSWLKDLVVIISLIVLSGLYLMIPKVIAVFILGLMYLNGLWKLWQFNKVGAAMLLTIMPWCYTLYTTNTLNVYLIKNFSNLKLLGQTIDAGSFFGLQSFFYIITTLIFFRFFKNLLVSNTSNNLKATEFYLTNILMIFSFYYMGSMLFIKSPINANLIALNYLTYGLIYFFFKKLSASIVQQYFFNYNALGFAVINSGIAFASCLSEETMLLINNIDFKLLQLTYYSLAITVSLIGLVGCFIWYIHSQRLTK